jgi:aspartyl-tRNA(Asn)/glutamyl-tRNA(Gln) amidotransferase subunit A
MTDVATLAGLGAVLEAGTTTSRTLTRRCLDAIDDPGGDGPRAFVRVYAEEALRAAEAFDKQSQSRGRSGLLHGLPISIKDLFDVAGETTRAGSTVLGNAAPAVRDATVIARLRAAGAVIVGRTNMTEFAFSGLGINPHYGTPRNPYDRVRGRIPGGSSSGAAVSVAGGMAAGAVGTDTGGSVRIPAALCGLTGFKPSASRVPTDGALPLSPSLDSVGSIAPTVACCALLDGVLSGDAPTAPIDAGIAGVRIGVLQGYVLDDLEAHVANCFQSALTILSKAGAKVEDVEFKVLVRIAECNRQGGFAAAEAYAWHRELMERAGERYDPRVLARILRGREISPDAYRELVQARQPSSPKPSAHLRLTT